VAVIGAGPAGLAAGYFLARAGLEVTIFDQRENPGGTVAYVIPDFRIKDEAIARDLELVRAAGVRFRLGVDPGFDIARLKEDGFRYIFLAPGAGKARTLDLDAGGENIRDALAFLEDFQANREKVSLRPRVAVIGGGNTAMDAARAALRVAGVEKVYIIYRRSRACMPASREELEEALAEGVVLKELLAPRAWVNGVLRCQKMELSDPDASGRPGVVARAGEFEDIAVDVVLAAVGQEPDYGILKKNGIALDSSGRVVVDPDTHETSIANVFLGGDARRGAATIVEAIADGSKVARAILAREGVAPPATAPAITFDRTRQRREITAKKGILRPAAADAAGEHERCLECSYICNICVEVCPNRANIAVSATGAAFRDGNQILHIDSLCNECGNCATFCPYDGAPYKDKLTLFEDEADFNNSRNNGFLLLRSGEEPAFRVRVEGRVQEVKLAGDGSSDADLAPGVRDLIAAVYQGYKYLF
jgi:putative selenate reductase